MRGSAEIDGTARQNVVRFGVASNIAKLCDCGVGLEVDFFYKRSSFNLLQSPPARSAKSTIFFVYIKFLLLTYFAFKCVGFYT